MEASLALARPRSPLLTRPSVARSLARSLASSFASSLAHSFLHSLVSSLACSPPRSLALLLAPRSLASGLAAAQPGLARARPSQVFERREPEVDINKCIKAYHKIYGLISRGRIKIKYKGLNTNILTVFGGPTTDKYKYKYRA